MDRDDDTVETAYFYLRCLACAHEYGSHNQQRTCPICKSPQPKVRGLAINRVKRKG